ncbi:MAG: hypothetical protein IJY80_05625, partial [Opitutales bacterium]|nr:hypothetical protein [Opitutales bacterium]
LGKNLGHSLLLPFKVNPNCVPAAQWNKNSRKDAKTQSFLWKGDNLVALWGFSPGRQDCLPSTIVTLHQQRNALGFGYFFGETVGGEDGAVVVAVGATQVGRHRRLVVKVGERTIRVALPRVQYRLRSLRDFFGEFGFLGKAIFNRFI